MKKSLLAIIILTLINLSCQEQKSSEKVNNESLKDPAMVQPTLPVVKEEKHTASIIPSNITSSYTSNSQGPNVTKEQEILKSLSLTEIFTKNMPFTENKGQLEKWYKIKIDNIGDVKFYTQAFGGTAYFGKNGIGIGFYKDQLEEAYHKSPNFVNPEEENEEEEEEEYHKKKEALFFYIDHQGSNSNVSVEGWHPKEGKVNYFKGKESDFVTDISNYDGIIYKELYKNIDLKYSYADYLVYDYIVKPEGKVSDIKRNFSGIKNIKINSKGELEIHTDWGILLDKKIYAYQMIDGQQKEVKIKYKKLSENTAGYEVEGKYDKTKELIIDPPTLTFATYVTSSNHNGYIYDLAIDDAGDIYATGWSNGAFALVSPSFDVSPAGGDAFVLKLKSDGTTLLYSSFIGGDGIGGDNEAGFGIAVNSSKQAYVAGFTDVATNFPTAGTPLQSTVNGSKDIFVVKINATGSALIYSTFYGDAGDDRAYGVAVNSSDEAFITGWTTSTANFSTTGAFQTSNNGGKDAFVLKISDPTAGTVVKNYCTYFGGTGDEMGRSIGINGTDAFIAGVTTSTGLSTVGKTYGGGSGGGAYDAFITRINGATGNNRVYCTYVGGDFDEKAEGIAVSSSNEAYITGWTKSILRGTVASPNPGAFPVVNAITGYTQNSDATGNVRDGFMTHVNASGTIVHSTFIGAAGDDNLKNGNPFDPLNQHRSGAIAINSSGNVAVVMSTDNGTTAGIPNTLPTVLSVDPSFNGGAAGLADAYLFVLLPDVQTISFSTFLGGDGNDYPTAGVKFDVNDCVILGGTSHSTNYPTTAGVVNPSRLSTTTNDEYYVSKFCTIPLPVEMLYFKATLEDQNNVLVDWATVSEKNNDYFTVERSLDGVNFSSIGTIKGKGNSSNIVNYSFPDLGVTAPVVYYRLKQVDIDGAYTYSTVEVVYPQRPETISIKALSANSYEIGKTFAGEGKIEIRVIDALGRIVYSFNENSANGTFHKTIDLNVLSTGIYFIQVTTGDEKKTEKVVVNQ